MMTKRAIGFILLIGLVFVSGCAGVISEGVRNQVNDAVTLKAVRENPKAHIDEMTLWTGEIIGAKNEKEGTLIEILQKPPNLDNRPKPGDTTEGRFLALYKGYLDVAIYKKGRDVTVAGRLKGQRVLPLGEIEYTYPVILVEEIHLWPERTEENYPHFYHDHHFWPRPYWRHW
jgi:outer membrane lipoprotein